MQKEDQVIRDTFAGDLVRNVMLQSSLQSPDQGAVARICANYIDSPPDTAARPHDVLAYATAYATDL